MASTAPPTTDPSQAQPPGTGTGGPPSAVQGTFDDLGTPLRDVVFVVVDLETTGGAPADAGITEIGAVKVQGGEVLGEFQTLVNPGVDIPPFIASLTGITNTAVAGAPDVAEAVESFLGFASGAVLVAHNAPYDTGFLRGACQRHGLVWPRPSVIDTARIARAALTRDEAPNRKLATLARLAGSTTEPNHRALADARATVDVLHFLIARVGDLGVHTLEELAGLTSRVSNEQRRKRVLADGLPTGPGVYLFRDYQGRPLYIGKSGSIRNRVRTYFTASEQRRRMAEMVRIAESVTAVECATALEAEVRESRLLAEHKPPYNRRSRFPEKEAWLKLTAEPFPRLSVVSRPGADADRGAHYLGPFAGRSGAARVAEAIQSAVPLRTCSGRLPAKPTGSACAAAELGQCLAPCDPRAYRGGYEGVVSAVVASWETSFGELGDVLLDRALQHAGDQRYERARQWRDQAGSLAEAVARTHRYRMLSGTAELVAARPVQQQRWEIHVIRHGRLAAAGRSVPGVDPRRTVADLLAVAEPVADPGAAGTAASLTELGAILRWLAEPGVRLVEADPPLHLPLTSAHRVADQVAAAAAAQPALPKEDAPVRGRQLVPAKVSRLRV